MYFKREESLNSWTYTFEFQDQESVKSWNQTDKLLMESRGCSRCWEEGHSACKEAGMKSVCDIWSWGPDLSSLTFLYSAACLGPDWPEEVQMDANSDLLDLMVFGLRTLASRHLPNCPSLQYSERTISKYSRWSNSLKLKMAPSVPTYGK